MGDRLLLLFVDGLGLAPESPSNPLAVHPTPALRGLLGGPLTLERAGERDGILLSPLDARLGVEGLPQSATGQTALFTGVNGAELMGRHVTGFPGPRLRGVIAEQSLFRRARERSLTVTFANAYSGAYFQAMAENRRRRSVTTCAVEAAGIPFRQVAELRRGAAVAWDIEQDLFASRTGEELPRISAAEAGERLARLAGEHDLTVYETFLTDLAGHGRLGLTAELALDRLDGLLAGFLAARDPGTTLVLVSDHGNLEDAKSRTHTANPVPLLADGPLAGRFAGALSILEITPRILAALSPSGRVPS